MTKVELIYALNDLQLGGGWKKLFEAAKEAGFDGDIGNYTAHLLDAPNKDELVKAAWEMLPDYLKQPTMTAEEFYACEAARDPSK